jgi:hypothetical protein
LCVSVRKIHIQSVWCVCVQFCIPLYIQVFIHLCTHICMKDTYNVYDAYMYKSVYGYIYNCLHICIHECVYHMYCYMHAYSMQECKHIYVYIYIYTHTHTHTQTYRKCESMYEGWDISMIVFLCKQPHQYRQSFQYVCININKRTRYKLMYVLHQEHIHDQTHQGRKETTVMIRRIKGAKEQP